MQFKLTDLLKWMACMAVGAWLYSMGVRLGLLVWLGTAFGIEVGSRSDYPTILVGLCGTVFGMALTTACYFTTVGMSHGKVFMYFNSTAWWISVITTWMTAGSIFYWLITRINIGNSQPQPTGSKHINATRSS